MLIKKFTKPLILLLFTFFMYSCSPSEQSKDKAASVNVPELLQRSEKIQVGKEWDVAQNFYAEKIKSLKENPNDYEAKLGLAQLYVREARVTGEHGHYYPAALQMCAEILSSNDLSKDIQFRTLMTKAGVQLSLHEFETARITGEEALTLNQMNAQIYGVLVDAYVELGQYDKAVQMSDKMINIKPDLRSYSRVSYLREIHGDVEGSKKAMKLAVDAGYPGYDETAWAMMTLGDIYNKYGEPDKARIIYESILQERENYPFAIAAIADVEYQKGNLEEAEKMLNTARNIIPEVGYYTQLADIYKDQERTKEFDAIMKEIFLMLKDDEDAGHNMNLEYVHIYSDIMENQEKALEYALKEYNKRPENIDVNRALASVYSKMNKPQEVKKYLDVAEKTNSKHPEIEKLRALI